MMLLAPDLFSTTIGCFKAAESPGCIKRATMSLTPPGAVGTMSLIGWSGNSAASAGIESADCFASVTNGDNRNLMMAQVAKHIYGVKRVITRLYDPIRADVYRELGLETFCSTAIGSGSTKLIRLTV